MALNRKTRKKRPRIISLAPSLDITPSLGRKRFKSLVLHLLTSLKPIPGLNGGWRLKKITLVIPAYNEENRIKKASERFISSHVLSEKCRFLFIVDGNDRTYEILEGIRQDNPEKEIQVKKYPERLGKGGAVGEGIKAAKTDYVGFLDVDISLPIEKIEDIVQIILKEEPDCSIGKRKRVEGAPILRKLSSRIFNIIVNLLFGLGISDTQCGCKFFKRKLVYPGEEQVFMIKGFAFDVELLKKIKEMGGEITEYEIMGKWEGGKFSILESPKMLLDLIRLRFF
ncbi:glycosyltransferase [Candidatus Micrarchaeota archaeon]|nr:glycosyltransferase [Candidatus Micrarchaeota archaeon]